MLTLVVIAYNEADRIERCLASVPSSIPILLLDSGSADETVRIANRRGARVVCTDWPGFVTQKNRALQLVKTKWVLFLDADEWMETSDVRRLLEIVAIADDVAGFRFQRRNFWQGRVIRHGRFGRDAKIRLIRSDCGKWVGQEPHDRLEVVGLVQELDISIFHDPYRNIREHWTTACTYARIQAEELTNEGRKTSLFGVGIWPILSFVDSVIVRQGWRDGWRGVAVASIGAAHVAMKWSQVWQNRR